ncbi:hypothetical protein HGA91_06525 [candidate division WWE3 bacterium]|nr:hypothetical protein [candidate division WWE3 bacterium]
MKSTQLKTSFEELKSLTAPARLRLRIEKLSQQLPHKNQNWNRFSRFTPLNLALALLVVMAVGGPGLAWASETSHSGEILYPIKKLTQTLQLSLTDSPKEQVDIHVEYAEKEIEQIRGSLANNEIVAIPTVSAEYEHEINDAVQVIQETQSDTSDVIEKATETLDKHSQKLEELLDQAPSPAQETIAQTIISVQKTKQILADQQEEIQKRIIVPTVPAIPTVPSVPTAIPIPTIARTIPTIALTTSPTPTNMLIELLTPTATPIEKQPEGR